MTRIRKDFTIGMSHIEINLADIPTDRPLRIEYQETGIVILRTGEVITAFYDSCPHASWRLSEGWMSGNVLECPGHGWQFDVVNGQCLDVPAYCLRPVAVSISGEKLQLELDRASPVSKIKACHKDEAFV